MAHLGTAGARKRDGTSTTIERQWHNNLCHCGLSGAASLSNYLVSRIQKRADLADTIDRKSPSAFTATSLPMLPFLFCTNPIAASRACIRRG